MLHSLTRALACPPQIQPLCHCEARTVSTGRLRKGIDLGWELARSLPSQGRSKMSYRQ